MPDPESVPMADTGRRVILHPGQDGWWVVECPSLPGCISQGKTKAEAITNIRDAIQGYIASLRKHGEEVPEDDYLEAELVSA